MNDIVLNVLLVVAYAIFIFVLMEWFRTRRARKNNILAISAEEFQKQAKGGQIIDVREKEDFKEGHISGARNFSIKTLKHSSSSIRKDQVQFVYGLNYRMAKKGANALYKAGYGKVVVMKADFEDYKGRIKTK